MFKTLVLSSVLLASPAVAAEAPAKPSEPYLDLQTMGLPAVVHGRLVNYIFVDVRLKLARGADPARLQDQEPYVRDAIVRMAARTPFNPPDDGLRIDRKRLLDQVMQAARAQFGPGKVVSAEIKSQTPQRRMGVPGRPAG